MSAVAYRDPLDASEMVLLRWILIYRKPVAGELETSSYFKRSPLTVHCTLCSSFFNGSKLQMKFAYATLALVDTLDLGMK